MVSCVHGMSECMSWYCVFMVCLSVCHGMTGYTWSWYCVCIHSHGIVCMSWHCGVCHGIVRMTMWKCEAVLAGVGSDKDRKLQGQMEIYLWTSKLSQQRLYKHINIHT